MTARRRTPGTAPAALSSGPAVGEAPAALTLTLPEPTPGAALARGRELAALFAQGQLAPLWAAFLPTVQARWGSLAAFQAYRAAGLETYGAEATLLHEGVMQEGDSTAYTRTATFERDPSEAWTLVIGLDESGRVQDFGVVTAAPPGR